ncbi:MAG: hypothetical protein FWE76_01915 [Symbiobacteriaceae bacterium]|nr:hypothetical protein [Symbiobacteriaceae bacterium]
MSKVLGFLRLHKEDLSSRNEVDLGGRLTGQTFTVRPLSYAEWNTIQKQSTVIDRSGATQVDTGAMFERIVLACCQEPDFSRKEDIEEEGCLTPKEFLHALLLPGEIVDLGKQISRMSGFDKSGTELVEEAKN